MTGYPVAAAHVAERRLLHPASVRGVGAAPGEPAAGRRIHGTGDLSLQHAAGAGPFHLSDRILVMYLGEVVEESTAQELYTHPLHPYTKALRYITRIRSDRCRTMDRSWEISR